MVRSYPGQIPGYPPGGLRLPIGAPYVDFDFWLPEEQSFPSSPAEVAALGMSSSVAGLYTCQDDPGATLADASGNGITLTQEGTAAKTLTGQTWVGFDDGSTFRQRAFECVGGGAVGDRFAAASAASFNYGDGAGWSILIVFRINDGIPSSTLSLLGKRIEAGANDNGWYIGVFNDGRIFAFVNDGAGTSNVFASGNYCDGAPHWALVKWDPVSDTLTIDTDLSTGNSVSTAARDWTGVPNASTFGVGGITVVNPPPYQLRGAIIWDGVDTSVAAVQAWWRHGRAPAWLTYARASMLCTVVEDGPEGDVVACWSNGGTPQVAYEYDARCSTNPRKLGLSSYVSATNLLTSTRVSATDYVAVNLTKTDNAYDSPRGFRAAVQLTKTGTANSFLRRSSSVASGTAYTYSAWVWWDGTNTSPRVRIADATGTTVYATSGAHAGGSKWRRLSVTWTATLTGSVDIQILPSDATDAAGTCYADMPMQNTGLQAKPWIPTRGGTASSSSVVANVNVPGLRNHQGTIKCWCTTYGDNDSTRSPFSAITASGNRAYSHELLFSAAESMSWAVFNAAGASTMNCNPGVILDLGTTEGVITVWWDKSERYGWSIRSIRNEFGPATSTTDFAAEDDVEIPIVTVGRMFSGATLMLDGAVSKLRVWRYPELAA